MNAQIGDWLLVPPGPHEHHLRRGMIIGLFHPDGSPPYQVRWIDDDRISVVFPPPDAHLQSARSGANV